MLLSRYHRLTSLLPRSQIFVYSEIIHITLQIFIFSLHIVKERCRHLRYLRLRNAATFTHSSKEDTATLTHTSKEDAATLYVFIIIVFPYIKSNVKHIALGLQPLWPYEMWSLSYPIGSRCTKGLIQMI